MPPLLLLFIFRRQPRSKSSFELSSRFATFFTLRNMATPYEILVAAQTASERLESDIEALFSIPVSVAMGGGSLAEAPTPTPPHLGSEGFPSGGSNGSFDPPQLGGGGPVAKGAAKKKSKPKAAPKPKPGPSDDAEQLSAEQLALDIAAASARYDERTKRSKAYQKKVAQIAKEQRIKDQKNIVKKAEQKKNKVARRKGARKLKLQKSNERIKKEMRKQKRRSSLVVLADKFIFCDKFIFLILLINVF